MFGPYGLYAEKLSGAAFTAPRHENQQTWLNRILPSAAHKAFEPYVSSCVVDAKSTKTKQIPNQLRLDPFDLDETVDWVHSLRLPAGAGDPTLNSGLGILSFAAGRDMQANDAFYSADGDFLIVLQHGIVDVQTELGHILVRPNEILVVPRSIRYRVTLPNGPMRGYVLELYQGYFQLPDLGPIGSNFLANARDFQAPVASFDEDTTNDWTLITKFDGELFSTR